MSNELKTGSAFRQPRRTPIRDRIDARHEGEQFAERRTPVRDFIDRMLGYSGEAEEAAPPPSQNSAPGGSGPAPRPDPTTMGGPPPGRPDPMAQVMADDGTDQQQPPPGPTPLGTQDGTVSNWLLPLIGGTGAAYALYKLLTKNGSDPQQAAALVQSIPPDQQTAMVTALATRDPANAPNVNQYTPYSVVPGRQDISGFTGGKSLPSPDTPVNPNSWQALQNPADPRNATPANMDWLVNLDDDTLAQMFPPQPGVDPGTDGVTGLPRDTGVISQFPPGTDPTTGRPYSLLSYQPWLTNPGTGAPNDPINTPPLPISPGPYTPNTTPGDPSTFIPYTGRYLPQADRNIPYYVPRATNFR